MILLMFLSKKTTITTGNDTSVPVLDEYFSKVVVEQNGKPHPRIDTNRITCIVEQIGYWRKANFIHNWFVNNVQQGKDDFNEYPVSKVQLTELYKLCQGVLDGSIDKQNLLLTRGGYNFGSKEYDNTYEDQCKKTIDIIEPLVNDEESDYFYQATW